MVLQRDGLHIVNIVACGRDRVSTVVARLTENSTVAFRIPEQGSGLFILAPLPMVALIAARFRQGNTWFIAGLRCRVLGRTELNTVIGTSELHH